MRYCKEDDCDRPVENKDLGLCATHNRERRRADKKLQQEKSKKRKPIKKQSSATQQRVNAYFDTCAIMKLSKPMICEGCGRPQGGDIKLSFSHLISRDYCIDFGRPDLYSDENNIKLHCMDWEGHVGCHTKWESNKLRPSMPTYQQDMDYVKMEIPELYNILKLGESK